MHIEKCKFIQLAQYDDNEDYNPNQEAFDSCSTNLVQMFPEHPEVIIFQTTYLWGDKLKSVKIKAAAKEKKKILGPKDPGYAKVIIGRNNICRVEFEVDYIIFDDSPNN